ncbi:HlyD family type I secretion periplasmic adaptor subunit [Agrobacterium tumefaciens]|jgi:membrane fusion protein|uniref:HlyD family type I secretion periplasmic adaptor subunit n=1 Tax=Agrobacterium tumefaciens TaxID=358 RepID=UPI000DD0E6DA|nr:HlyD family type I secretion periplasmic adaptor subunit [Agrobacterium tumefaciens]MBP2536255.1 membrane fusion protein [Agrobacterium tumefaciens]MDP9789074.1 membrane fusion protein [Agrobacterium tumefaciens]MDP9855373.1 membrane fusion protein [Agrobacterium tumefaciens]
MSDELSIAFWRRSLRRHTAVVIGLGLALFGGVGGWAATTKLAGAVSGQGFIVIENDVKKIQHLSGGTVSELLVHEGSEVAAGDVLLRLSRTTVEANLAIIENALVQSLVRAARLRAELAGTRIVEADFLEQKQLTRPAYRQLVALEQNLLETRGDGIEGMKRQLAERKGQLADEIEGENVQIEAVNASIAAVDEEFASVDGLYRQQLVTLQRLTSLKQRRAELQGNLGERLASRAQAEGRISEVELQILQLDENRRGENAKELAETEANITEMEARRVDVREQFGRLDIRSPVSGRIFELQLHTVGGIVQPGETLMLVAPRGDGLIVEAKISPRNIDQVTLGQKAQLHFTAFDRTTTPTVKGEVVSVSPDVLTDQRTGQPFYAVRIRPEAESLEGLGSLKLYPGMPADVLMPAAERRVISYLVKPLTDQLNHVFRED